MEGEGRGKKEIAMTRPHNGRRWGVKEVPLKLRMTSHVRQLKGERNTRDPVHAGDVGNLHRGDSQPN